MTTHQIMKWIFILCVTTLIVNGSLYLKIEKEQLMYSIYSAVGLGVVTGIGMLITRKK